MSKSLDASFFKRRLLPLVLAGLLLGLAQTTQATAASTLTVCTAGPPSCQYSTIPDALAVASDGDTVTVAPGTYDAGFPISHNIRLIGSGQGATVITGGDPAAITISSGATVVIRGVTITGAAKTGVINDGAVTLREASVTGNNPFQLFAEAGGVLNNGTLVTENTTMSHNWAYGGGAVANYGTATLDNSVFIDNAVLFNAGAVDNYGDLVVRDSTVESNHAQGAGGFRNGTQGEALVVNTLITGNGGEIGAIGNGGVFTLRRSTVNFNSGFAGLQPAIENWLGGSMAISESAIDDNSAGIGNQGEMTLATSIVNGNAIGGGIENSGSLTVRGSTVSGNTSSFEVGGGIKNVGTLVLTSSTVSGNTARSDGGGIANAGSLTLRASIVTQNTSVLGLGGGIFNYLAGTVTLRGSSISGNTPDDCFGC